jgi:hypothetical protein
MIYAIARSTSKITSSQFIKFCKQIDAPLKPLTDDLKKIFNTQLIEDAFLVDEIVFNAAKIRNILQDKLHKAKITVLYETKAERIISDNDSLYLTTEDNKTLQAEKIINCSYAKINTILASSELSLLPLKHEYAEMPLVKMPERLRKVGLTIMDGPFFSLMPFPDRKAHSFHHVRYTPHFTWFQDLHNEQILKKATSHYLYMQNDAVRYIPALRDLRYITSLYQVKTVLQQNEVNDGRPILYRKDYGFKNFDIVMGGKIDNIYDVFREIQKENIPENVERFETNSYLGL